MVGEKGLAPEVADRVGDYVQQHGEKQTLPPRQPSHCPQAKARLLRVCVCVYALEREGKGMHVCVCTHAYMCNPEEKVKPLSFSSCQSGSQICLPRWGIPGGTAAPGS